MFVEIVENAIAGQRRVFDFKKYSCIALDMLLKRYGHFTDQTRREAMLKFDGGCPNGAQPKSATCKSLKINSPKGNRTHNDNYVDARNYNTIADIVGNGKKE